MHTSKWYGIRFEFFQEEKGNARWQITGERYTSCLLLRERVERCISRSFYLQRTAEWPGGCKLRYPLHHLARKSHPLVILQECNTLAIFCLVLGFVWCDLVGIRFRSSSSPAYNSNPLYYYCWWTLLFNILQNLTKMPPSPLSIIIIHIRLNLLCCTRSITKITAHI